MRLTDKIIKSDITSRISYTIVDDTDGIVRVVKNTNNREPEPYEGICPEGKYIILADLRGLDFSRMTQASPNDHYYKSRGIEVDSQGKAKIIEL